MLMTRERRPAIRTLHNWAINVLNEAGAIRECEDHGWMQDRADPHAREHAVDIARRDPPPGSRRSRQPSQSRKCWIRSATPARSARLRIDSSLPWAVGVRAGWVVESGFKPLFCSLRTLQLFLEEGNEPGERFGDRFGLAAN
jgi:hypothetical protein